MGLRSVSTLFVISLAFSILVVKKGIAEDLQIERNGKSIFINYSLKKENMNTEAALSFRDEDGQFEVLIIKDLFPVASPNCKSFIKLRMPSTLGNQEEIYKKKNLFQKIQDIRNDPSKSILVKINISPYIKVIQNDPFKAELQYCNVFFAPLEFQKF